MTLTATVSDRRKLPDLYGLLSTTSELISAILLRFSAAGFTAALFDFRRFSSFSSSLTRAWRFLMSSGDSMALSGASCTYST